MARRGFAKYSSRVSSFLSHLFSGFLSKPFAQILPDNLYEDLLHHYLVPGSHKKDAETKPTRGPSIDSELFNSQNIWQIDSWIIGNEGTPDFTRLHEYKLLLRGSRDGFTPTDFHRLCDD